MNQHLAKANEIYESNGIDFQKLLSWHLCFGLVVCDPYGFAMCFFSNSEEPDKPCEIHHSDTIFVTMFSGDMRRSLGRYSDEFQFLAFQRDFQNSPRIRVYDMDKFLSKLK